MSQHGHFLWNELNTRDPEAAKAFYQKTIGWTFDEMPDENGLTYWIAKDGNKPVAGIFDMNRPEMEGLPPHWFAYLGVDDVDARVEKAISAGAEIIRPAFDVPEVGRIAIIRDVTGAAIGWMTPANSA